MGAVPDGLSNTVLMAERFPYGNQWPTCPGYNLPQTAMFAYVIPNGPYPLSYWTTITPSNGPLKPAQTRGTWGYMRPWSPHPGGMVTGLADGSVRTVSYSISEQTWLAAITPDDGAPLGSDW